MSTKCNYCWRISKMKEDLVHLKCNHLICVRCINYIKYIKILKCPFCYEEFVENDLLDNLESPSESKLTQMILSKFKSYSKQILSNLNALILLKRFDLGQIKLFSKNSSSIPSITSDLHLIKNSKIIQITKLAASQIQELFFSLEKKKIFLRILLSQLKLNQCELNSVYLGQKLVTLKIDKKVTENFTIRNDGESKITLKNIGFGISIIYSDLFYFEKFSIFHNENSYRVNGCYMIKDGNGISFNTNFKQEFEINPNSTLTIVLEHEPGIYLAIKNQMAHNYKGCSFVTSSEFKYSLILYLHFK